MKFLLKPLSVVVGVMILTACATTKSSDIAPVMSTQIQHSPHGQPKEILQEALKSQLRSSFDYRTEVYVSNQIRREVLANATPEQLSAYDDMSEKCNITHDEAYVALLKTVKADDGDIDDDKYSKQKKQIKKEFLACQNSLIAEDDIFALGKDHDAWVSGKTLEKVMQAVHDMKNNTKAHDIHHTALDAKKATLVHEYLIKPTAISMVGSYEPLKGVITALPSANYHAKNIKLHINQPVYVDLNAGGVYFWADNFALANSQALDKTLGDKWKDKWLFLPINDGSLPENFTKDFIMAIKEAQKERFMVLPAQNFGQGMTALPFFDNLPTDKQTLIKNTPHIIAITSNPKDKAYADYVFKDNLYHTIVAKYPMLAPQDINHEEREIVDGESVIHVKNTETTLEDKEVKPTFNSRFFMTMLMSSLQNQALAYQDELASQEDKDEKVSQYTPVTHYGLNGTKIAWLHQRYYPSSPKVAYDEPVLVDVFTQILPNHSMSFERLPTHLQRPTADNTVNLFDYQDKLQKALENSDDKYLGILSNLLFGQGEASAESLEGIELGDEP
ncbi:hypothetical protein [Moraxella oblonga]|uniref:hypothetical protein n=1 Tax=Moraxella oblonga TaxID=200413 RepID=UPI0008303763|nr:hypothetical protein [Moraxella oblonga]